MNSRTRLFLSIGIPVLLIVVVVGTFLWQQRASGTGTVSAPKITQTSCADTITSHKAKTLTSISLALDWTPNTNHTGIYVALAQKWYQDEGIDLHLLPYSASVSPDVLVNSGKADVGISSTEGIVADAAVNQPVVSIAAIDVKPTACLGGAFTVMPDVMTDRSVIRRTARLCSLTLAVSDKSVPAHCQPRCCASGLNVSRSTVLPTPRRPVRTMFSRIAS